MAALLLVLTPFIFDPRLVNPRSVDRYLIPRDTFFLLACTALGALWALRAVGRADLRQVIRSFSTLRRKPPLFALWEGCLTVLIVLAFVSAALCTGTACRARTISALQPLCLGALLYLALSRGMACHAPTACRARTGLLAAHVLTAGLVGLHCLLQYHGVEPMTWFVTGAVETRLGGRGVGYIGNPSHAGVYLASAVPIGLGFVGTRHAVPLRAAAALSVLLAVTGLFTTGSRTGTVALVVGVGLFCSLVTRLLHVGGGRLACPTGRRARRALAVGVVGLLATFWLAVPWLKETPVAQRLHDGVRSLARGEWETVIGTRPENWRIAWSMIKDHPAVGTGIGTFTRSMGHYKLRLHGEDARDLSGEMYAQAHNEYLQVWSEMGTAAMLAAVAGTVALLAWGTSILRRDGLPHDERWIAAGLTAAVGALAASSLLDFVFHLSVTALPAIVFAAGLATWALPSRGSAQAPEATGPGRFEWWSGHTLRAVVVVCAVVLAVSILRPFRALYEENRADFLLYLAGKDKVPADKLPLLLADAESAYRKAIDIYPQSVHAYVGLAYVELQQDKHDRAIATLRRALRYLEAGEIYTLLGEAYVGAGNLAAAREAFEKSLKLKHSGEARDWLERLGTP